MAKYLDLEGLTYYHGKIKPTINDVEAFKKGDKVLVNPVISKNTWVVNNHANNAAIPTASWTNSGTTITVPTGANVTYTGQWKWTADVNKKSPESASGSWGNTLLKTDVPSGNYTTSKPVTALNIKNETAAYVTLSAKRKGLMLNGQKIIGATGNDAATASAIIQFRDNVYYGNTGVATPDANAIAALTTVLTNTQERTLTVTTNTSQYFCYAYPVSYGPLKTIVADGADPILENFTAPYTASVTNKAGLAKDYYVYVSANMGAFNNNSLAFKK